MSAYLVVVRPRVVEAASSHPLMAAARILHIDIAGVAEERRYLLKGDVAPEALAALTEELLVDPVLTEAAAGPLTDTHLAASNSAMDSVEWAVDVAYRPGVTDNEGDSVYLGAMRTGVAGLVVVRTVRRTLLRGTRRFEAEQVAQELLANDLVEATLVVHPSDGRSAAAFYRRLLDLPSQSQPIIRTIPVREAEDRELEAISRRGVLSLDLDELHTIQRHFRILGREPTDGELETIAQTWSEHCSHKTFKARIHYQQEPRDDVPAPEAPLYPMLAELSRGSTTIEGLLKTYLVAATEHVRKPWLLSAFVDNAGIVAFGDEDAISFKVETHNHPSALEPFGGANTGVGGVVRDVLGVSGQPIANLDVLCFGPTGTPRASAPETGLNPARVAAGVVAGVRDYGNKLGVPTVAGAVLYDPGYTHNPLVFCGTVGLAPRSAHRHGPQPGDAVVVVGGRTGRDGIHGATFSSVELTHETAETVGAAVQIGDPVTEKRVIDVLLQASERGLFRAITDCGAGGLSSAVGEMGEHTGVAIELEAVPLKYPGLQPWEIWLSEAQERMVVAVPPEALSTFLGLCRGEDVEATPIGHFTSDRRLVVTHRGATLVDLQMSLLHDGRPQREMNAAWVPPSPVDEPAATMNAREILISLLGHPNIASKEAIVRTYDHLVQGRTIQGPLAGLAGDAPADGVVLQPRHDLPQAIAIGCGINPRYGIVDPYWMALAVCDEAMRNVVAAGGDPAHCSLLDNFCWGDPREPDRLAGLVRAAAGCHDVAVAWGTPFISGKDSLNNEYRDASGRRVPILGTLLISALASVPTLDCVTTMELKDAGSLIYLIGLTRDELGGSHRLLVEDKVGANVPRVDLARAQETFARLHRAIRDGLVRSCHDLSEGGLGVAAAEMTFGSDLGLELDLRAVPYAGPPASADTLLWSESPSRFLVEVLPNAAATFEESLGMVPAACVGRVSAQRLLRVVGLSGEELLAEPVTSLKAIWQREAFAERN